jgi:hypothetical protein
MAAYLNDRVLDNGLTVLDTEATHMYICSAQPATYAEATSTYALGNKSSLDIGAPAAHSPTGRQVQVAAITDGSATATGTATHYAIVDSVNSRLLAANTLSASQVVTSGNTWSTAAYLIYVPAPA